MTAREPFPLPVRARRSDGAMRRCGIEIEFGGLMSGAIVEAIVGAVGGTARSATMALWHIEGTVIGDLRVELDSRLVQQVARDVAGDVAGDPVPEWLADVGDWTADVAERVATLLLPWEVVTSPVPMDRLAEVDAVVEGLRAAGARGTRQAPYFAFGVHLNPEMPDLDAATVVAYFKAYLCLKDWLRLRCRPDLARVVSPYISDFDNGWVRSVVAAGYAPDLATFIDDYLEANPTRNRSLDMLPLIKHLDADRLARALDEPLVNARPTLHYRLPNSEVDDVDFSLRPIWVDWLEVERLAADPERLAAMGESYARWLSRMRLPFDEGWAKETERWL